MSSVDFASSQGQVHNGLFNDITTFFRSIPIQCNITSLCIWGKKSLRADFFYYIVDERRTMHIHLLFGMA